MLNPAPAPPRDRVSGTHVRCRHAKVPARRDFVAELNVVSVKGTFQPVRQHPLNTELKRDVAASGAKTVVAVKKPVIVSKGKSPLDDPLSAFGIVSLCPTTYHCVQVRFMWVSFRSYFMIPHFCL